MKQYPIQEKGLYHLTPKGWIRRDNAPYPPDRLETWSYAAECPSDDAKEQVCLRRIWKARLDSGSDHEALRSRFGIPVALQTNRNVLLECEV